MKGRPEWAEKVAEAYNMHRRVYFEEVTNFVERGERERRPRE
jgi:hypothetical protein